MQLRHKKPPFAHNDYAERINALEVEAATDGYSLRKQSEEDFWQFVESEPSIKRGFLVLIDNGNLRLTWKDGKGTQLGLQFLGSGMVQYVIFRKQTASNEVTRVAGRGNFDKLKRQNKNFQLASLLYE